MKTELTIEESAKLIELGVDANLASMVSWKSTKDWKGNSVTGTKERLQLKSFRPFEDLDCKDIFTLTDILSILPKDIGEEKGLSIEYDKEFNQWWVGYNLIHLDFALELIDALYQLLIWCIESGYCKSCNNKEK